MEVGKGELSADVVHNETRFTGRLFCLTENRRNWFLYLRKTGYWCSSETSNPLFYRCWSRQLGDDLYAVDGDCKHHSADGTGISALEPLLNRRTLVFWYTV